VLLLADSTAEETCVARKLGFLQNMIAGPSIDRRDNFWDSKQGPTVPKHYHDNGGQQ
jgi:hypothetical protein